MAADEGAAQTAAWTSGGKSEPPAPHGPWVRVELTSARLGLTSKDKVAADEPW